MLARRCCLGVGDVEVISAREVSLGVGMELARARTNGSAAESLSDAPT